MARYPNTLHVILQLLQIISLAEGVSIPMGINAK